MVTCETGPEDWARALCAGKRLYFVELEGEVSVRDVVFDREESLLCAQTGWALTFDRWAAKDEEED